MKLRLIDADWLKEHMSLYSFNTREDVLKFVNDAPTIDTYTVEDISKAYDYGVQSGYRQGQSDAWMKIKDLKIVRD